MTRMLIQWLKNTIFVHNKCTGYLILCIKRANGIYIRIKCCQRDLDPYNATPQTRQLTKVTNQVRTNKLLELESKNLVK